MHPDPKHLKNFARNTQWSRGKRVMNILFLRRSHLPGFERLKARGLACHLIRAIGHHIVRLACRSVKIMARLSACWRDHTWTEPLTKPGNYSDAGVRRFFNRQSCKPVEAEFVPGATDRLEAWNPALHPGNAAWRSAMRVNCDANRAVFTTPQKRPNHGSVWSQRRASGAADQGML
jgi:hypothetical protein